MQTLNSDQLAVLRVALTTSKDKFDGGYFSEEYKELCDIFETGCGVDVRTCEEESARQLEDCETVQYNEALDELYNRG